MHHPLYRLTLLGLALAGGLSWGHGGVLQSKTAMPGSVGVQQHKPVSNVGPHLYAKAGALQHRAPVHRSAPRQTNLNSAQDPTPAPTNLTQAIATNQTPSISTNRVLIRLAAKPDPEKVEAEKQRLSKNLLEFQQMRADQGSSRAQYDMGVRYLNGDGVEQDKTKAVDLFKKASAGGESMANRKLTQLGEAVPEAAPAEKP